MAQQQTAAVRSWLAEVQAARKRERDFRHDGRRVLAMYGGRKPDEVPFNILYSNTETMAPALYSAVPRPVVARRFKDADPLGKHAAEAARRVLDFLLDTNEEGYETFDEALRAAVLDALLPGRAVTRVKYDAEVVEVPDEAEGAPSPYKRAERVCLDACAWDRVLIGEAKKWSAVPWVAFEEQIDRQEATRLFGATVANRLVYTDRDRRDLERDEDATPLRDEADRTERARTVTIYQIWDKDGGRKLRYVAECWTDDFLKVEDDPLGLTGFFPCPRPLQFLDKPADLTPTAPYLLYENQAKELNELTRRLTKIVKAIKARGVYDGELGGDLANVMKLDDNELVAAERGASLAAEKGLQHAIWFMPIEQLIATAMQLVQAREACKRTIYEITGIADIMRGASNASETLGAQQIKQSWGTLRLKRVQREVQRYCRDLMRIMLELAATKFSEATWAQMTGLPFVTGPVRQQAQAMAQAAQLMGQPVDAATQQALAAPEWAAVLALLQDDLGRAYRIDIETNSTVEPEAVEDQRHITELMTALGQYLNGVGPLVAKGVLPFGAAQAMLLAITRRFRFGSEVEGYIEAMQPPAPPDQAATQAEAQARQADIQLKQAEWQLKQQTAGAEAQQAQQAEQTKVTLAQLQIEADRQAAVAEAIAKQVALQEQLKADRAVAQMQASLSRDATIRAAEIAAAAQVEIAKLRLAATVAQTGAQEVYVETT